MAITGKKIKEMREENCLSIYEVAKRSGLQRTQLRRIEEEEIIPSTKSLEKILKVFGKSLKAI